MRRLVEGFSAVYRKKGYLLLGAAALAVMLCVLFCGQNVGLSDNGDFSRVMAASSLSQAVSDRSFYYVDEYAINLTEKTTAENLRAILFGTEGLRNYPSLQVAVVRLSVALNLIHNKIIGCAPTVYRLGMLGLLYSLLYAAALTFLFAQFQVKRPIVDFVLKCILIVILCDVGYIAYFNSFYGEALQIVSLAFCAACLVRVLLHEPRLPEIILCAAAAVVFGGAKFFNVPAACFTAVFLEGVIWLRTRRRAAVAFALAAVAVLGAVLAAVPPWMDQDTTYNAVFFGVVKDVDEATAEQYLADLGLPAGAARFRNTNYYVDGVPAALKESGYAEAVASISKTDLLFFYLKHPARLLRQMNVVVLNCGFIRPYYLSNYDETAPRLTFSHRFSLWSDLRLRLSFDSWLGLAGIYAAFISVVLLRMRGQKWFRFLPVLAFPTALLLYSSVVPIVSNGEGDLTKHMFLFAQLADWMVIAVIAAALAALAERRFDRRAAGCAAMAVCLAVLPVKNTLANLLEENRPHSGLEAAAHVTFGTYAGERLIWRVVEVGDGTATLLCTESLGSMRFSEAGGSAWETSSLRAFLNGPLLENFSQGERALLLETENSVLLSRETKGSATAGETDFYCTQIPSLAARGYDLSYRTAVFDRVTLPDVRMIAGLSAKGADISGRSAYWLRTPYFNNGFMVRCVFPDGYVYFREADEAALVRPVIRIAAAEITGGAGSASDPFTVMAES